MNSEGPEETQPPSEPSPPVPPPVPPPAPGAPPPATPPPADAHAPGSYAPPQLGAPPGVYTGPPPIYSVPPGYAAPGYYAPPPSPRSGPPPPGYGAGYPPGYPPLLYAAPPPGGGGPGAPRVRRPGLGPWPQGIADIIGTIFRLYGQNFVKLCLLSLVVTGIPALLVGIPIVFALALLGFDVTQSFLQNILQGGGFWNTIGGNQLLRYDPTSTQPYVPPAPSFPFLSVTPDEWLLIGIGALFGIVLYILLTAWQMGSLSIAARDCTVGRPLHIGAAMRGGLRRLFSVLGTLVLVGLILISLTALLEAAIFTLLGFALTPLLLRQSHAGPATGAFGALLVLGFIGLYALFYVAYIYLLVRLGMAPYIAGAEALSPGRALGRSWKLVRGNWWRTFTPLLVVSLALSIATNLVTAPGEFAPIVVLFAILVPLVTVLSMPLWALSYVVMYYDLRLRREGYAPLAGELGLPPAAPPPPIWPFGGMAQPPSGPAQSGQAPMG